MNTKANTPIKERKGRVMASTLFRLAGLSAMVAGLCFLVIGLFHPANVPASVTSAAWANVHIFAVALGFFGLFGMTGLYARQVEKAGWLGLAGFLVFSLWLVLMTGMSFVEAFILPRLATASPAFVAGFLGMITGVASEMNLGVLPALWVISGPLYIFGPLMFAIATFRAGVLSRWAAGLLAFGSLLTPVGAVVPAEYEFLIMIPVGLGLAWLGYALFSERRVKSSESLLDQRSTMPEPGKAI